MQVEPLAQHGAVAAGHRGIPMGVVRPPEFAPIMKQRAVFLHTGFGGQRAARFKHIGRGGP